MANGTRQAAYVKCAFCGEGLTCAHGNCTVCEECRECKRENRAAWRPEMNSKQVPDTKPKEPSTAREWPDEVKSFGGAYPWLVDNLKFGKDDETGLPCLKLDVTETGTIFLLDKDGNRLRLHQVLEAYAKHYVSSIAPVAAEKAASPLGVLHDAQKRVVNFTVRCFGAEQTYDPKIRALRLVEEAIEMCQAVGVEPANIAKLTEHTYGKEAGDPHQELGGVALTALAMATALHRSFENAMLDELERVESEAEQIIRKAAESTMREALEKIKTEVGTSTSAWHIANAALDRKDER